MGDLYIRLSRYLLVIVIINFTLLSIYMLYLMETNKNKRVLEVYTIQKILIAVNHTLGFIALIISSTDRIDYIILYIEQMLLFIFVWFFVEHFHKRGNFLLWNITLFFMSVGFIILTRLDLAVGIRQFRLALLAYGIFLIVPLIFSYINFLDRPTWLYLGFSFLLLLITNSTMNGSKNWFSYGNFSFQPSEFVKIIYIFFVAAYFAHETTRTKKIVMTVATGLLIVILGIQRDLGTALIFYVLYMSLIYIITSRLFYVVGGAIVGAAGATMAYYLFSHIKVRVEAFINPWTKIDSEGYQITQSLFAISNGGIFGTGLNQGNPLDIPVVITDFVYSAVSEEFGNLFSFSLIVLYMVLFMLILQVAKGCKRYFHFILVTGIGIVIAFQTILIIGGVTKLLPITGVTLPFISYGGSSLIVTFFMLSIVQGVYTKDRLMNKSVVRRQ